MLRRIALGLGLMLATGYLPALAIDKGYQAPGKKGAKSFARALPEGPEMFDLPSNKPRVKFLKLPVSVKQTPKPIARPQMPIASPPPPLLPLPTPLLQPTPPPIREYIRVAFALPIPWISVKTGYWCADSETVRGFLVNSDSLHTAEIEVVPFATDAAFRFSCNYLDRSNDLSAHFWDASLRWKRLVLGIRQEDLRTIHSTSWFWGTNGTLPLIAKFLKLKGDLVWGPTFAHAPENAPNRLIADWNLRLVCSPNESFDISLGYRDYFFGTANDIWGVATMSGPRSAYFGSYEGPLASLDFLF